MVVSRLSPTSFPRLSWNIRRVVRQIQEQSNLLQRTVLLKITGEKTTSFQVDTHGREYDGEVVVVSIVYAFVVSWTFNETSLTTDLRGDFVVWKTGSREDGDFLATSCIYEFC